MLLTNRIMKALVIGSIFFCSLGVAAADEILDSINEGLTYYKEKDYTEARDSLQYAAQLLNQFVSEEMKKFLPEPLAGWRSEEAEVEAAGAPFLGGMTGAKRVYFKDNSQITVTVMGNAPMLAGMLAMFSNPAYATANGGKLSRIKRQKAIVKYNSSDRSGEIQMVVANKYLITLEGSEVEEKDMTDYASAIDFKGLKEF